MKAFYNCCWLTASQRWTVLDNDSQELMDCIHAVRKSAQSLIPLAMDDAF